FTIGFHEGQASGQPTLGEDRFDSPIAKHCVSHMFEMEAAAVSVILMGVCDRFPELRVGFLEASGGWMAGLLDRMDRHAMDHGIKACGLNLMPSEIFRRQCFISFEPVEGALKVLADYIGPTNILWATDYPHVDGFLNAPETIRRMGLAPETLAGVLGGGARRFYGLDRTLAGSTRATE
ncbi:MAG: amidohydrolase family protein, partial [Alphaproteobacteria bacterium]